MEELLYWIAIASLTVIILWVVCFPHSQKKNVSNTIKHHTSTYAKSNAVDESLEERIRRRKVSTQ